MGLTGVLTVGYAGVPFPTRKRTVEIGTGVENMYALLQTGTGQAEVQRRAGIRRLPVAEEAVENDDTQVADTQGENTIQEQAAVEEEESSPMLIYIIVGAFLAVTIFVGAIVMYLRRSKKAEKKVQVHPTPITVEANKNTAAMA